MPGKKSGLGKGLDSLIPNKKNDISASKVEKKQEKENEIRRLKMENELLRDFLRLAGSLQIKSQAPIGT